MSHLILGKFALEHPYYSTLPTVETMRSQGERFWEAGVWMILRVTMNPGLQPVSF